MPLIKKIIILMLIFGLFFIFPEPILTSTGENQPNWIQLDFKGYPADNYFIKNYTHPILLNFQSNLNYDLISGLEFGPLLYQKNNGVNLSLFDLEEPETGVFNEIWSHSAPALIDFNNDKQLDILIGDSLGNLHLMVRNGTTLILNETYTKNLNVSGYAKPTAADINNDMLVDLIVGDMDGHLSAFINEGSIENPNWVKNEEVFRGIRLGDFASPIAIYPRGKSESPDLVIGTEKDGLTYIRNKGINKGAEFPSWDEIPISDTNNPFRGINFKNERRLTPFLIDLDQNDNRYLDLIVGNEDGGIEIFKNEGIDLSNISPSPQIPIVPILILFGMIIIPLTIVITLFVRSIFFRGRPIYLLLLHSSGITPYSHSFTGQELEVNTLLAGGAFVGIQSLLAEITKSPDLKSLDAGKYKILIHKVPFKNLGGDLEILLWATADDKKLRKACDDLAKHVINTYLKQFRDSYFDESFISTMDLAVSRFIKES